MQDRKIWIVSIGCGLVCAVAVVLYLSSVQGQIDQARSDALSRYGGDQLEVCVAKRDIVAGETVTDSDVETKLWVAALLPEESVTDKSQVVGSVASSTILSGEVISERRLGSTSSDLDVPAGLTAISVPAKNVQAVGGAVSAGSKVDLYSVGDTTTAKLGTDLLVLATSTSSDTKSNAEVSWITLAVSPESVEELVSASQRATLYFTLPGEDAPTQAQSSADSADEANSASNTATSSGNTNASASSRNISNNTNANTNYISTSRVQ